MPGKSLLGLRGRGLTALVSLPRTGQRQHALRGGSTSRATGRRPVSWGTPIGGHRHGNHSVLAATGTHNRDVAQAGRGLDRCGAQQERHDRRRARGQLTRREIHRRVQGDGDPQVRPVLEQEARERRSSGGRAFHSGTAKDDVACSLPDLDEDRLQEGLEVRRPRFTGNHHAKHRAITKKSQGSGDTADRKSGAVSGGNRDHGRKMTGSQKRFHWRRRSAQPPLREQRPFGPARLRAAGQSSACGSWRRRCRGTGWSIRTGSRPQSGCRLAPSARRLSPSRRARHFPQT